MAWENLGVRYTLTEDNVKAIWKLRTNTWADIESIISDAYIAEPTVGSVSMRIGQSTLPGKEYLVLSSVKIDPWDDKRVNTNDSSGLPTCDQGALVTLTFETVQYEIKGVSGQDGEAYMTHTINADSQMLTHAQSAFRWETTSATDTIVPPELIPGLPVTMVSHNLKWHNVYNPPLSSFYSVLGTVNSTVFLSHAIGTVLFSRFQATYSIATDGERKYTLSCDCIARIIRGNAYGGGPITWNHFLRNNANSADKPWQKIQYATGSDAGDDPVVSSDFTRLLTLFDRVVSVATQVNLS